MRHLIFALFAGTVMFAVAEGHEVKAGKLVIVHPWVRATPPGVTTTAGYAKITNTGTVADRLTGASLGGVRAEIHSTAVIDGIVSMRPLPEGLSIGRGQTVELKPGAHHIMFGGLIKPLEEDTHVEIILTFERAGQMPVEFFVEPPGQAGPSHNGHERHEDKRRQ